MASSDQRKDLPPSNSAVFLERVRETLSTYLGKRGDPLDRGVTLRDLSDAGLITLSGSYGRTPGTPPISGPGSGIGGGTATDVEEDPTPPPTPTGVIVTSAFSSLIIEHDQPTYTQGHGHGRTRVYGATWEDGGLPTFLDAVPLTDFVGNIFSYPTTLGTQWHLWLTWITNDGYESLVPSGGINGHTVVTGRVGNSDLGDAIIEAEQLATGAVSASKLAAEAVDLTKFANGIEPVAIVDALPGSLVTRTVLLTTDSKLYRWNGTSYIKSVDGADLTANSITAGKIAAGAVGATQIAAGAITTDKLLVTGRGRAVNDDPSMSDATAWAYGTENTHGGTFTSVTDTTAPVGATVLRLVGGTQIASKTMATSGSTQYKVGIWLKQVAGTGLAYVRLYQYSAAGTMLHYGLTSFSPAQTMDGFTPPSAWTRYQMVVVTEATAATMFLSLHANWITSGELRAADFRIEEYVGADLIVDGSIIASKLAAGSITVGSAAIQDGAIRNALIENLAVDSAKIANGAIVTAKIGDAQITAAKIGSVNADTITAGTLSADRIGANTITAAKINANGLIVRDTDGTPLFGSGVNLDYSRITAADGWLNSNLATVSLVGSAGITIEGATVTKSGGSAGWNAGAYSRDGFTGGAYVSFRPAQTNKALMVGLNVASDLTDPNYGSIDFAMYCDDGVLRVYTSGNYRADLGAYSAGDVLAVTHDGVTVRWMRNGAELWSIGSLATAPLYVDSSFDQIGGKITDLQFGAMSSNDWSAVGGSGKPQDNATWGATFGSNISGQITSGNVSTYIAGAAIDLARINTATITNLAALTTWTGTLTIGNFSGSTDGYIRMGATDFFTGNGAFLGWVSGEIGFRLGDSNDYIRWRPSTGWEEKRSQMVITWSGGAINYTTSSTGTFNIGTRSVTVTNGTAPYTYQWSVVGGPDFAGTIYISGSTTTNSASFRATLPNNGSAAGATAVVVVTDATGRTKTATLGVTASNTS